MGTGQVWLTTAHTAPAKLEADINSSKEISNASNSKYSLTQIHTQAVYYVLLGTDEVSVIHNSKLKTLRFARTTLK